MSNKTLLLAVLLTLLVAQGGWPENALAQQPWPKERPACKTIEEVLSDLSAEGKVPVAPSEILVDGNVPSPQSFTFRMPLTITRAVAMVGGARAGTSQCIYLFRRSLGEEHKLETLVIDLRKIMSGNSPDVMLAGGDAVYVLEGCVQTRPNRLVDPVRTTPPSVAEKHFRSRRRT